jgi:hypothetical protein
MDIAHKIKNRSHSHSAETSKSKFQNPKASNMISIKSILRLLLVITALLSVDADETVPSIHGGANAIIAEAQNRDLQEQEHRMLRIREGGSIHDEIMYIDIAEGATELESKIEQFCAEYGTDVGPIQEFCDKAL